MSVTCNVCVLYTVPQYYSLGVDASPMMTWGSIEGTPLHLETDITPGHGPAFKIPHIPRREEIAHKLADKATKSTRERKKAAAWASRCVSVCACVLTSSAYCLSP